MGYRILDVDVRAPVPCVELDAGETGLALVVRHSGRPIGFMMRELPAASSLSSAEVERWIRSELPEDLLEDAPAPAATSPGVLPSLTVAVCTKDNPDELARCLARVLEIRAASPFDGFELLVVDNAPSDGRTHALVGELPDVRYVCEPKAGLNFARNHALREARGEMLAFVDDDVGVDRYWLIGLAAALSAHPDAAAVTGLALPAELDTEAQVLFERRGGFEKSFRTIRYGRELPGHPFYPCVGGKFGTGCNMAVRVDVLRQLGGFDEALDTGRALPGGGDTDAFYRVVRAGHPLVYEPRFMVFHRHRRALPELRRQFARSWGQGLMAFVAKSYGSDPEQRPNLRRLVRWWYRDQLLSLLASLRGRDVRSPRMVLAELWGGTVGLTFAYPRSRLRVRRIRRRTLRAPWLGAEPS